MDRRLLVLALGMFALGTDTFVMAGVLPEIARTFGIGIGGAGQMCNKIGLVADKPFAVVRVGGDVVDNGKLLRLQNLVSLPYFPGRLYLLLIHTGLRESKTDFYPADAGNIEIRVGKVQFDAGAWEGFRSGVN